MGGICACPMPGYSACGTSCVDRLTDETNCGTCGRVCTGSLVCLAGSCTCDPPVPGTEVRVTNAADISENVAVAWNGSEAMVVWSDRRSGTAQIYAQRLSTDGSLLGAPRILSSAPTPGTQEVDVVWTGTEWGVAWSQSNGGAEDTYLRRLAPDGAPIGSPVRLRAGTSPTQLQITYTPSLGYVTAHDPGIMIQSFGAMGTTPSMILTLPMPLALINGWSLSSLPSGVLGVLMTASGSFGPGAYLQTVNADGSLTAARVRVASTDSDHPVLSADESSWIGAWRESATTSSIVLARGSTLASRTTVIAGSTPRFRRPTLHVVGSTAFVTWQATADTVWRIDGRRYLLPASGAATPLDLVSSTYMPTTSVYDQPHGMVAVPGGVILAWADSRWGATEVYEQFVSMTPCAP